MSEKTSTEKRRFITISLKDVLVGEPLPGDLFLFLGGKFVTFRAKDDTLDRAAYERLDLKNVHTLFIEEKDKARYEKWSDRQVSEAAPVMRAELKNLPKVRESVKSEVFDLFQSHGSKAHLESTLQQSKKLVSEVMKAPFAAKMLRQLHTYSRSAADHSLNVSVLSVYLAQHMGYSHKGILQNVGAGALLHDVGKSLVQTFEEDTPEVIEEKMKAHVRLGAELLERDPDISLEVRMIVAQHHECFDGTGYPKKLKSSQIYDLSRIVSIANVFDELVSNASGTLRERQRFAIHEMETKLYKKFDHNKLYKALRILQFGL